MECSERKIQGADGLSLNLVEWSQEGVPMLLLHGYSNEAHIWDDFIPHVAPHYRVLALDLRGHGDSDWHAEGAYDYENHVDDIEAIVEALGIERLVVIGHSLGGRIAMLYAGRNLEKIAGLVIVDSAPELDHRGTLRISMEAAQNHDPSFGSVAEYEQMLVHLYPSATSASIRRMALHGCHQREDDGRWILKMDTAFRQAVGGGSQGVDSDEIEKRQAHAKESMWEALKKISCPTLVVRGAASDILSAEVADRMADEVLARGELAVVAQAGHSVMTDNPEGFNAAVSKFVLGE
ncbi:MAG TPA: alpha/beta hydrolase [Myxococcales bacterium]|nr:alpha/beta hydrolase [Myxococcales bacterium]